MQARVALRLAYFDDSSGLCVAAQSSSAVPIIDEIDIPALGVVYDSVTGNFVVAGLAFAGALVARLGIVNPEAGASRC